jgi:hypothetical protein
MSGREYKISPAVSQKLSVIKFFSIVMVVYGHSLAMPVFSKPIYVPGWIEMIKKVLTVNVIPITMPGYFILSSIFLYSKPFTWVGNLKKKMRSIAVPYIIINTFWVIFFKVMSVIPQTAGLVSSDQYRLETWTDLFNAYFGPFPLYYPFWFMRDLFILNILASVLWYITDRLPFVGLSIGCIIAYTTFPVPFICNRECILYWIIGMIIVKSRFDLDKLESLKNIDLLCAGVITGVLYYLELIPFVFSAIPLLALMYNLCGKLVPYYGRSEKFRIAVAQSFIIYAFHEYYEAMIKKIIMTAIPQPGIVQLLELVCLPVLIIILCIVAGHLMQKLFPRMYLLIMGRRPK